MELGEYELSSGEKIMMFVIPQGWRFDSVQTAEQGVIHNTQGDLIYDPEPSEQILRVKLKRAVS